MLLYKGPRDQILAPLQSVCGIVEKRHTLPILSNVLMEKDGERLTLLATDIEIQITHRHRRRRAGEGRADGGCAQAAGHSAFPARIGRSQPDSRRQASAAQGRQEPLQPADLAGRGFPAHGRRPTARPRRIKLTQKQFKRLLALVQYSMAQQDIRYYLNGLLLVVNGTEMRVVATDGHRLAYRQRSPDRATCRASK